MEFIEKPAPVENSSIETWKLFFNSLPEDLLNLVSESDGSTLYDSERDAEFQMLSLRNAVEYYNEYHFKTHMKEAVPICMDGNGNFAVYRKSSKFPLSIYLVSSGDLEWESSIAIGNKLEELFEIRIEDRLMNGLL